MKDGYSTVTCVMLRVKLQKHEAGSMQLSTALASEVRLGLQMMVQGSASASMDVMRSTACDVPDSGWEESCNR